MFRKYLFFLCLPLAWMCYVFAGGNLQNGDVETNEKVLKAIDDVKNKRDYCAFRALELSLYYQGFDTEKVMYCLDGILDILDYDHRNIDEIPHNSELVGVRKIRDAKKSFEYAQKAYELRNNHALIISNLAAHYISGIGVEKDLSKISELENAERWLSWKNYYIGKFAPFDRKHAISLLEKGIVSNIKGIKWIIRKPDEKLASYYLYLIYSGQLNPEDKDLEKAKYWKSVHDKLMSELKERKINEWNAEIEKLRKLVNSETKEGRIAMRRLAWQYLKKREYVGLFFNKYEFIENPNYNPELAKKNLIKSFSSTKVNKRTYLLMIVALSKTETGDLTEMKKYLKEALSSSELSDDDKKFLFETADSHEKNYKEFYTPSWHIDNMTE